MSIEQQIQACEEHITQLEQLKRNAAGDNVDPFQNIDHQVADVQLNRINKDLDDSYQQMAILKIRRMMGY